MPSPDREKRQAQQRAQRRRLREAVIAAYGGCCVRCGFSDSRALQLDHVDGGGVAHQAFAARDQIYRDALRALDRGEHTYQLLCANCNWIKRAERGEYVQAGTRHRRLLS